MKAIFLRTMSDVRDNQKYCQKSYPGSLGDKEGGDSVLQHYNT